ncbi:MULTISPECIES: helix-turn-helix domain-containing protein [Pelosinus]|uniref:DNA binding domain protein, excisionase family n=1 Tax=Pelosinus fermentans B4 TaxID=1149862 RepID=I8RLJ9_9FIRM|nr:MULTISPECIES: helix-turn-helix domain-containing protein [Pelosinus]EIW19500.1 DNA binding domain protein, excisionase family [Pelosinus fermentans B4]EIW24767.1 DNA binding domain protein, excisionase family [Pelosinus fermentans A11]OAM95952.1 DNA binding domain protein, excisionase family [Pelosinus fermentans DSM 17108]SDR34684.1 DNA binding domain-containing protein, excisionase family [Pelosinus fermentans]
MQCKCGITIPTKAKFCPECGTSAPVETKIEIQPIKQVSHILTVNEASVFLKISRSKLYELVSQDAIPWFPVGSHKRFLTQELLDWAKNRGRL